MSRLELSVRDASVDSIPEDAEVVVLGVDGVEDYAALVERAGAPVLVVEPDPARLAERMSDAEFARAVRASRVVVHEGSDPGECVEAFSRGRDPRCTRLVLIHGGARTDDRARWFDAVARRISERERDEALDRGALDALGKLSIDNALTNLSRGAAPLPTALRTAVAGRPGVLVSAGPSLDRNARGLAGLEDRAVILAVDTAVRPLARLGVRPHVVVAVDPRERNVSNLADADLHESVLVTELSAHPDLGELPAASRGVVVADNVVAEALEPLGLGLTRLAMFGSVATAALELAISMQLDPIVFLGQDLAFTGGEQYAANVDRRALRAAEDDEVRWEDDLSGEPVRTTLRLQAFRDWLETRMLAAPDTTFINATGAGILKRGVLQLDAEGALERCRATPSDLRARLTSCFEGASATTRGKQAVARLAHDASRCVSLLECFEGGALKPVLDRYLSHQAVVRLVEILESRPLHELSQAWPRLAPAVRERRLIRTLSAGVTKLERMLAAAAASGGPS